MKNITVKDIVLATGGELLCGDLSTPVCHIALDSRKMEGDDIFIPIIGEKTDGHLYIEKAFDIGAVATLTSEHDEMLDSHAWIKVDDTTTALQKFGGYLRDRFDIPFVGVTGSVGKTTTREMIAAALSACKKVTATAGNSNSQVGVPVTLSLLDETADVAILELGMSMPGEMSRIAAIGRPNIAVMTNIGVSHIEFLGSQENIMKEKLHITDGFDEDGVLIVNGDDKLLKTIKGTNPFKVLTYGTTSEADYYASDISYEDGCARFTAHLPSGEECNVKLSAPGTHNALNALAALAVADTLSCDIAASARALSNFKSYKGRLDIYEARGIKVIDDSYNASPDSMKAALEVLSKMEVAAGGRKIAILADMLELGENSPRYHEEVGEYAVGLNIDAVYTVGELAGLISDITADAGIKSARFNSNDEIISSILPDLKAGDIVLFKGSNGMRLSNIIKVLKGE